jgi:hypothetical protein
MPPLEGLFSEAELHARLVDALGALPDEPVATLRAAWQAGRAEFRRAFMMLMRGDPKIAGIAPVLLYRAIGPLLPEGSAEAAAVWGLCQTAAQKQGASMARAGFDGPAPEAADALFDALLAGPSAVVFSIDDWTESFQRVATANGRIQLAIPELFDELDVLATEPAPAGTAEFPLVLSAGERRSFTANTIIRNPAWRNKDRDGALRMHPDDAARAGVADGGAALLTTRRGEARVLVEVSDRMLPGHVSLPNGQGLDYAAVGGVPETTGVSPNELTSGADRDWFAGTPWHKHVPARVMALE